MSFRNREPLPIEARLQYAESIGYKRLDVIPVEHMSPTMGGLYLEFQKVSADNNLEEIAKLGKLCPPQKVKEYLDKLEQLLGLMTDTGLPHHAEFLGFRMARQGIGENELASIVYSYFIMAEQMMGTGNYKTSDDPLANFGIGFKLGHSQELKKQASARIDEILKQLFDTDRVRKYKSRAWAEADQFLH